MVSNAMMATSIRGTAVELSAYLNQATHGMIRKKNT